MALQLSFLIFRLPLWLFKFFTKWLITLHHHSSYSNIETWNFTYNIITNNITIYTCNHIRQNKVETTWQTNKTQHYDYWVLENSNSTTSTCCFSVTYWKYVSTIPSILQSLIKLSFSIWLWWVNWMIGYCVFSPRHLNYWTTIHMRAECYE